MFRPIQCLETPKIREEKITGLEDMRKLIDGLTSDIRAETTRATEAENGIKTALTNHIEEDNPHNITAELIGAATSNHKHKMSDIEDFDAGGFTLTEITNEEVNEICIMPE